MGRARGRAVRRGVVALVVGAVVSWGIAWWLAVYRPTDGWPNVFRTTAFGWTSKYRVPQYRFATPSGDVFVDWYGGRGYDKVSLGPAWTRELTTPDQAWVFTTYPYAPDVPAAVRAVFAKDGWDGVCEFPAWTAPLAPGATQLNVVTSAFGWPRRCLCMDEHHAWDVPASQNRRLLQTSTSCIDVRAWTGGRVRLLPTRVAWAGFGVNTLVYAACAGALAWGIGGVRRRRRRARRACESCGYSRAGLTPESACPECGSPQATPQV